MEDHQEPACRDATAQAIVSFLERATGELQGNPNAVLFHEVDRWRRDGDGWVRPVREIVPAFAWHPVDLPRVVEEALRADPDFGPLLDGLVGTEHSTSILTAEGIVSYAAAALVRGSGEVSFDADAVRRRLRELRDFVRATRRPATATIPLFGVKSELFPVPLDEGIEIDLLNDDEIGWCIDVGVLDRPFGHPLIAVGNCVGVRLSVPLVATATPPGATDDLQARIEDAMKVPHRFGALSPYRLAELVEDVLLTFRLTSPGFVATRGIVLAEESPQGTARRWQVRATRPFIRASYEITPEVAAELRAVWCTLRELANRGRRPPQISFRRFNGAMDRTSADDAIVDHVIAAESLLLQDCGKPSDRTELGFRLSLRAATLLERAGRSRRATFGLMKAAYDLRNTIAHGSEADAEIKVRDREPVPRVEFVDELAAIVRQLLRTAIDEYRSGVTFGTAEYWDDLLFGPSP